MKRKPVQKLRTISEVESTPKAEYPYNLRLRFEKEDLDKLNIDLNDYSIDDIAKFNIKTKVMSLSSSESFEGADNKTIEFQIIDIVIEKNNK